MVGCNVQRLEVEGTHNSTKSSVCLAFDYLGPYENQRACLFLIYMPPHYSHFSIRTGKPDLSVEKLCSLMKLPAYSVLKTQV